MTQHDVSVVERAPTLAPKLTAAVLESLSAAAREGAVGAALVEEHLPLTLIPNR